MKKKVKLGKDTKFCPRCGAVLKAEDAYCTRCGYSFVERTKKSKTSWKRIIIVIIILVILYIIIRTSMHKPILPEGIENFFKNFPSFSNKTTTK